MSLRQSDLPDGADMLAWEITFPGAAIEAVEGLEFDDPAFESARRALLETRPERDELSDGAWMDWLHERDEALEVHGDLLRYAAKLSREMGETRWRQLYDRSDLEAAQ